MAELWYFDGGGGYFYHPKHVLKGFTGYLYIALVVHEYFSEACKIIEWKKLGFKLGCIFLDDLNITSTVIVCDFKLWLILFSDII